MRVGILGLGHVGLVNLCGFAKKGFLTIGFDLPDVVSSLKSKRIPFFEPGLEDLFESCFPKISLTDDLNVFLDNAEVIFLCVNTPYIEKIGMDISNITQSVERIAAKANGWKLIVEKSTVPISTHRVLESIAHGKNIEFACCPEFLREGQAIQDFFETDRIVIGTSSKKARKVLKQIFSRFDCEKLYCSIEAAELIKMASNAFLAMRISFINLISDLCELYEADITEVSQGIGLDHRIGTEYLEAGIGFGGSCLPKDLLALRFILRSHNINDRLLQYASVRILHTGDITPSTYLISDEFRMTKIENCDLNSVQLENELPSDCLECSLKNRCKGGVLDRRYLWYKDIKQRDPYCPFRKENYVPDFSVSIENDGSFSSVHDGYLPTLFFDV